MCQRMYKIRILCYRGRGPVSSLIRWFRRSEYSHVAFAFGSIIFEAKGWHGVRQRDRTPDDDDADVYYVEVTQQKYLALLNWCMEHEGCGYDWLGVLRFVSRRRHNGGEHRFFCGEFCAEGMEFVDLQLQRTDAWKVCPDLVAMSVVLTPEA